MSVLASGYALNDLTTYLPMTVYLRDPSLYPSDPLVEHLLRMPYPLYRAFAYFYDQHVLFAMWLLTRLATITVLYLLARQIVRDRLAAALAVSLIAFTIGTYGTLGLTQVLLGELVQYTIAVPICLLALWALLTRRMLMAFVLAGAAFDIQPMLAVVTIALITADVMVNEVLRGRSSIISACGYLAVCGVAALPGLWMTVSGLGSELTVSSSEFLQMVRFGAYFHIFPSRFSSFEYQSTATVAGFAILGLLQPQLRGYRRTLVTWLAVIAVFCLLGYVFSEVIPVALILKMMLFRGTLFFKVLGMILTATYLRACMQRNPWLGWVVAILATFGMVIYEGVAVAALALAGAVELTRLWRRRGGHAPLAAEAAERGFLPIVTAVGRFRARFVVVLPTVIVLLTAPYVLPTLRPPGDQPLSDVELLANWARESTPNDARFVAPPDPDFAGFKVFAGRSTLGDAKLAGQALFDPLFGRILYQRLADLGCHVPDGSWCQGNTYSSFDTARMEQLGRQYDACYVITRTPQKLALPELYANASFRVFSMCGG